MSRLQGLTVLLVEDDVDNLELIGSVLEDEGARILSAGSLAGALAVSCEQPVDVLVSDLELPDGDGCGLLTQLRQRDEHRELPAIAVTGYSEQKWRDRAAAGGFVRYAVKPFSLEKLVAWISELSAGAASASASAPAVPLLAAGARPHQ